MTGVDHETTAAVDEAERWLVETDDALKPRPVLPFLRSYFCLSTKDAVEAIRSANQRKARAA